MSTFNIHVIYTGGTIGSVGDPLAPLSGADFCKAFSELMVPTIQQRFPSAAVSCDYLDPTLDSTNLQPSDWCTIAGRVIGAPGDSQTYSTHDAFVILHGTDTMAWTASALSFLLTGLGADGYANAILSKPVIVTGSQLPLFYQADPQSALSFLYDTDAIRNVLGAIAAARAGVGSVGLYFDDVLRRGNRTLKTNASQFNAFSSLDYPPVARTGVELYAYNENILPGPYLSSYALDNSAALARAQNQLAYIAANIDNADVMDFLAFPAQYNTSVSPTTSALADMLERALGADNGRVRGLYLEGYGEGNFPSGDPADATKGAVYRVLKQAHDNGVVIVAGTQVVAGIVNSTAYAAGSWLAQVGCIGSYDMAGPATQAKLLYLLALKDYEARNWSQSDIENMMRTPIAGEMMDVNRLDSLGLGFLVAGQSISAFDASATLINDPDLGPVLTDSAGKELWRPISGAIMGPGRLIMQDDGNLVFYDRTNAPIWSTRDFSVGQAYSALILSGSVTNGSLSLYVYDYHNREVTAVLYGNPPANLT